MFNHPTVGIIPIISTEVHGDYRHAVARSQTSGALTGRKSDASSPMWNLYTFQLSSSDQSR